ncbi:hypothetical protein A2755_04105 [Candidatus Wolfebacteria bacterium RIFCSPHIGHO2_01_FULL_48_22]|uniref:Peptidase S9 prolyl oligopeptidase catalytic domain-containing protein n=1 Tax=Candidatus Wolfebacteria bacterium RIFCSPHIGHO2_01_FULL_48_22 TaxID=1802555 RepID=A0A1F8DSA2_9BACT|nr:MAG: hypothetical protein A2755_04105 [Candidatus Wolfebacteria bacterium RIFCSPHIGHO2_01_FULL_48_22]
MPLYTISSAFQSLPIEIFWYPAKQKAVATVFLLKGLYGLHNSTSVDSWDTELIEVLNDGYNFVCINTARQGTTADERSSKDAFVGKTFQEECADIQRAFIYLFDTGIMPSSSKIYVVGNSFGGTTLLGIPKMMNKASGIVIVGSGCGKSPTTTKPLLTTLYDEERLLAPLRSYSGVFAFVRGSLDSVVPKDSQDKIIDSARSSRIHITYTIIGAQHDLTPMRDRMTPHRRALLASVLHHVISLA